MSANDNVAVSIVADASGVRPAVNQTQSELVGLEKTVAELTARMNRFGTEIRESMNAGAQQTQHLTNEMRQLNSAIERDEASMRQLGAATRATSSSMGAMGGFVKGAIQGMIAAFTVQAVVHFTNAMGDAAERAEQMAQKTGMTVGEVQALDVALAGANLKMEDVVKGLGIMATKAEISTGKTNAAGKSLKAMGISAQDGSTNMERLLKVADRFKDMEDGPRKMALAMQLFGKSGKDLIPFLNQGSAAIREQMALAEKYGVVNERATERALALDAALDEQKIAWAGLKQTLAEAFAPLLTSIVRGFNETAAAMVKSYNEGGAVKVIFDAIATVIQGLRDILGAVGSAFAEVFSNSGDAQSWSSSIQEAMDGIIVAVKSVLVIIVTIADAFKFAFHLAYAAVLNFKANWNESVGQIKLIGTGLGMFLQVLGKVCEDALMLRWGSINADWNAGMENIRKTVAAKGAQIVAEAKQTRAQVQSELNAAASVGASYDAFMKKMNAGKSGGDRFGALFTGRKPATGGGTGAVPDFAPSSGGSKGAKSSGPTLAEKLEQELEARKTAWQLEQDAQGTAQRYSLQLEADYWAQALKRHDLGAKDKLAIEKKYLAAAQALKREEIEKQLDGYQEQLELAGANSDKKIAILREEQAFVVRMYGAESREARKAAQDVVKAEREKAAQLRELEAAIAKGREDAAMAGVDGEEAAAEFEVEMGRRTAGQLIAQQRQFENQRYEIRRQALLNSLRLAQLDPNTSPAKMREINNSIEQLERQHQDKLTQINRQATLQRTQLARQSFAQIGQTFGDHISKMITLQEGWKQGLIGIYQGLVGIVADVISQIIAKWITAFLTKLLLGKQDAAQTVLSYVGQAGAGGVASMAAAPFPINLTAPAFGASMAAAAAAYGSIAAAEGGDWNVREGMYHLHENEMVLPAWAASPLRNMVASGGSPLPGSPLAAHRDATRSSSQETNFHYSPTINHSEKSLRSMLREGERDMRRWVHNQARNGALKMPVS